MDHAPAFILAAAASLAAGVYLLRTRREGENLDPAGEPVIAWPFDLADDPALEVTQGDTLAGWNLANLAETLQELGGANLAPDAAGNQAAFLMAIRHAEGTAGADGYRVMFGGALFDSFSDHPRRAFKFTDQAGRELWTTAAGAYQFMAVSPLPGGGVTRSDTWDRIKRKLGLRDFSPESQDAAALALIDEAGALADVQMGRFADAVRKVRGIWASLPGAGYDQPERALAWLQARYTEAGGTLA